MLASYKSQGLFLENIFNLVFFKRSNENVITKIDDSKFNIKNRIIDISFSNNKYFSLMDIVINLPDKVINLIIIYNDIEETFECYFSLNDKPKKRIRFMLDYNIKLQFIQSRNTLFFRK